MKTTLIYDLPTRVFHWLFALLFIIAFTIGNTVDDDSSAFSYHMIAGIVLCFIVLLRLAWGIFGSKYARFSGFALDPRQLFSYFAGILTGDKRKWIGHNPASSWAAITMMAFALGLGITGYLMTTGQGGDAVEEAHELLANGFLIVVLLHLAGVAIHSLRHRDGIWRSMFNGQKTAIPEGNAVVRTYRTVGILFLLVSVGLSVYLAQNFDYKSRDLNVFGFRLNLGETEEDEKLEIENAHREQRDNDEDED